jgi:hypothetical protein
MGCLSLSTKPGSMASRQLANDEDRGPTHSSLFDKPGWEYVSTAELKTYENLWALSDVHGESGRLIALLKKAGLVNAACTVVRCTWTAPGRGKGQILVIAGDFINKGPDSVGVIRLVSELQKQAAQKKGKVILILGNHEAEFLSNLKGTNKETDELEASANSEEHSDWVRGAVDMGSRVGFGELRNESQFGAILRSFKVGAVVGPWLFAHAGYLRANASMAPLSKMVADVGATQAAGERAAKAKDFLKSEATYLTIADEDKANSSLISERDWSQKLTLREDMREKLDILGIETLLFGHDPGALNDKGQIVISKESFVKLDAGMNEEAGYSEGRMLKCPIPENGKLQLMLSERQSSCQQVAPNSRAKDGLIPIPIISK